VGDGVGYATVDDDALLEALAGEPGEVNSGVDTDGGEGCAIVMSWG
jgi:hypothetical protein